jgi:hypothetical protein
MDHSAEDPLLSEEFDYNHIYDVVKIPILLEPVIISNMLLFLAAMISNLIILPWQAFIATLSILKRAVVPVSGLAESQKKKDRMKRRQTDLARFLVLVLCSSFMCFTNNPSVIYHWVRSQGSFKLVMLKGVAEISDSLMKKMGFSIYENFFRSFQVDEGWGTKTVSTVALAIYVVLHAWTLTIEMLLVHVCITSGWDSAFPFVLLIAFNELKLEVFKKCDVAALYTSVSLDSVQRFQMCIYLLGSMILTNKDKEFFRKTAYLIVMELVFVDWVKYVFLVANNKIDVKGFSDMR